jgi:hypothetical protein
MAVAEAVEAGCIPFVPEESGPAEIVGNIPDLCYESADDAVTKIVRMMTDPPLQTNTRKALACRSERFSSERFVEQVRGLVEEIAFQKGSCLNQGVR